MGTIFTPQYVQQLAADLGVQLALEWTVPYALASASLPEGWSYVNNEDGVVSYINQNSLVTQRHHPLLDGAAQALAQLRAAATDAGGTPSSNATSHLLGPFENLDSPAVELFYHDVQTGNQVPAFESPPASVIPLLPDHLQQLITGPTRAYPDPAPATGAQQQPLQTRSDAGSQMTTATAAEGPSIRTGANSRPQSASDAPPIRHPGSLGPGSPGAMAASSGPQGRVFTEASRESVHRSDGADMLLLPQDVVSPSVSPLPAMPAPLLPSTLVPSSLDLATDASEDFKGLGYPRDSGNTEGYDGSGSGNSIGAAGQGTSGGRYGGAHTSIDRRSSKMHSIGSGHAGGSGDNVIWEAHSASGSVDSSRAGGRGHNGSDRDISNRDGSGHSTPGAEASGPGPRPLVLPPSGRLTFFGWWFEDIESSDLTFRIDSKPTAGGGMAPRHCTLVYEFSSASFTLTMRDPVTPPAPGQPYERIPELVVPGMYGSQVVMCDTGRPADMWDLHLGARLKLLGRQVVLKNSDLATGQWHAGYFRQLQALRDKLHQEVQKYKPRVLRPGLVADKGDVRLQSGQQLRHAALQVRELLDDLRQYRPAKAESLLALLPIHL